MRTVIATTAALLLAATPATAASLFTGTLSGNQETVPTGSPGTGMGNLTLADDMNSIDVTLNWANLTAPAVAGHIHCCAPLGANAPVAIEFAPANAVSGMLSGSYDLTMASTYSAGFLSAHGGTADMARTAFLAGLESGNAYFNIHTSNFPGGEIRGQIGAAGVPEPASWGLMIGGFGVVGGALRSRRRTVATA